MRVGLKKTEITLLILVVLLMIPFVASFMGFGMYPVISDSMTHWVGGPLDDPEFYERNYYAMWESEGYSEEDLEMFPVPQGFYAGDYVIAVKSDDLSVGDVVVWDRGDGMVMTHRLMKDNGSLVGIIGDYIRVYSENYTNYFDNVDHMVEFAMDWVDREEITGKVVAVVPKVGVPYLFFACLQNRNCDIQCFFNSTCLQRSFGIV
jgi:hypothetical protein